MTTIGIIIIGFAILLLVGNLSMIRATPFERWVGGFRDLAKSQGFTVRLVAQPEWVRSNSEKSQGSRKGMIAMYMREYTSEAFTLLQAKVVDGSLWVVQGDRAVHGMPSPLPSVKAVELAGQLATVYWNEERLNGQSDDQTLAALASFLQQVVKGR